MVERRWIYEAIHRFSERGLITGFDHFPLRYQEVDLPGRPLTQTKWAVATAAAAAYRKLSVIAHDFETKLAEVSDRIDLLPQGSNGGDDINTEVMEALDMLTADMRAIEGLEWEVCALRDMASYLGTELEAQGVSGHEINFLSQKLLPMNCVALPAPKRKFKPHTPWDVARKKWMI